MVTKRKGRKVKKVTITSPIKKLVCVCPEMTTTAHSAASKGGETALSWKYRDKERKQGKDVPLGGCVCNVGNKERLVIVKELYMSPSS